MTATPAGENWGLSSRLDRVDAHRRSAEWVRGLWYADEAHLIKITNDARLATNAAGTKLRTSHPFVEYDDQRHVLLGMVDDEPWFAVQAVIDDPTHSLREIGHLLDPLQLELAMTTTAILAWHSSEPYCPSCGAPSIMINGGFARYCEACEKDLFPRSDPAVIVGVVDAADRLLLARSSLWQNKTRVSVLAGYVEAGESFEQAVHREIGEEVDLTLNELRYVGSQPWPFPRSIMVGFFARADSDDFSIDDEEIIYADWFTREKLTSALENQELDLPSGASIAHRLITLWREHKHPFAVG